jgi:hypothetical protein
MCTSCDRGIEGQYLETDARTKFHPRCFTCTTCRVVLRDDYYEFNGQRYCDRHAQSAAAPPRNFLGPGGYQPRMEKRRTRLMMMAWTTSLMPSRVDPHYLLSCSRFSFVNRFPALLSAWTFYFIRYIPGQSACLQLRSVYPIYSVRYTFAIFSVILSERNACRLGSRFDTPYTLSLLFFGRAHEHWPTYRPYEVRLGLYISL